MTWMRWVGILTVLGVTIGMITEKARRPISEKEALAIAKRYVQTHHPEKDISVRPPTANYNPDMEVFSKDKGQWSVHFGIPAPAHYSRPVISYHVVLDRRGKALWAFTTSP